MRRYTMLDRADQITCPTLIIECEGDFVGGGDHVLKQAIRAPTRLVNHAAAQGAGGHCGGMGQRVWDQVTCEWIQELLAGDLTT